MKIFFTAEYDPAEIGPLMELGEVEGAISGLALAISGLLTVIGMALMGNLI